MTACQSGEKTERLAATQQENSDLTAFRTLALSRLAAQHEEILRLRTAAPMYHGRRITRAWKCRSPAGIAPSGVIAARE